MPSVSRWTKLWLILNPPSLSCSREQEGMKIRVFRRSDPSAAGMFPQFSLLLTLCCSIRYPDPAIKVNDTVKIK